MGGEDLFCHREVLQIIRAILFSKGIRAREDLEDHMNNVVERCIRYVRKTGEPPRDVPEAIAIARRIARDYSVDQVRKRVRRGKTNVPLEKDPDEHAQDLGPALDPVDQERLLAAVRKELTEEQIKNLVDTESGVPYREIAAESGGTEAAERKKAERSRKKARVALAAYAGGFAALLAGMVAVYVGAFQGDENAAHGRPPGLELEGGSEQERQEEAKEIAQEQRRVAAEACKAQDWDACERALDRAAQVDPEGNRGPEVKALREMVATGRRGAGAGDARP